MLIVASIIAIAVLNRPKAVFTEKHKDPVNIDLIVDSAVKGLPVYMHPRAGADKLTHSKAYPIFFLNQNPLPSIEELDVLPENQLYYTVYNHGSVLAGLRVMVQTDTSGAEECGLDIGPYTPEIDDCVARIERGEVGGHGSYEVCIIASFVSHFYAIWLKPIGSGTDLVYVLEPSPQGVRSHALYKYSGFASALNNASP